MITLLGFSVYYAYAEMPGPLRRGGEILRAVVFVITARGEHPADAELLKVTAEHIFPVTGRVYPAVNRVKRGSVPRDDVLATRVPVISDRSDTVARAAAGQVCVAEIGVCRHILAVQPRRVCQSVAPYQSGERVLYPEHIRHMKDQLLRRVDAFVARLSPCRVGVYSVPGVTVRIPRRRVGRYMSRV